jgi:hypothetical protein
MPYSFTYDFSGITKEVARIIEEMSLHKRIGKKVRDLDKRLGLSNITGLDITTATKLLEDLVGINVLNINLRDDFLTTEERALFLPHCSRKYMDNQCKAFFDANIPSYYCQHCSPDCLVNQATALGKKKGYDVYILSGGSCIPKILKENRYEGIVAVACSCELMLGYQSSKSLGIYGQALVLTKNGCAQTEFSIEDLKRIL